MIFYIMPAYAERELDLSSPDALVRQALATNTELTAIEHHIRALKHKSQAVQHWMDPVLSVEYGNFPIDSWKMGESPMTGVQLKLSQSFTLAGKNSRREASVQAQGQAMRWMLEEKQNQLVAEVRRIYWSLALTRRLGAVVVRHTQTLEEFVEMVRAKYQSGVVAQHDLMRLELFRDKLKDDLLEYMRRDKELTSALNAALHREPTVPIETPKKLRASPFQNLSLAKWFDSARSMRPLLKALDGQIRSKRLAADLAAYERWPDITLWAGYRIRSQAGLDDGTDQMSIGLSLPLPLNYTGSSDAQRDAHLAEAASIEAEMKTALDRIHADLEAELAAWERFSLKARTYQETLIPNARRAWNSGLAAYQSGQTDITTLFALEVQLFEFERELISATVQTHLKRIRIGELVGMDATQ